MVKQISRFRPLYLIFFLFIIFTALLFLGQVDNNPHLSTEENAKEFVDGFKFLVVVFMFYFVPSYRTNKRVDGWKVFWLNLFIGWTIIGWIWLLIKSFKKPLEKNYSEQLS